MIRSVENIIGGSLVQEREILQRKGSHELAEREYRRDRENGEAGNLIKIWIWRNWNDRHETIFEAFGRSIAHGVDFFLGSLGMDWRAKHCFFSFFHSSIVFVRNVFSRLG